MMPTALVAPDQLPGTTSFEAVVPGPPISKNRYQRFAPRSGHSYITDEGREFQALVRRSVRETATAAGWIVDPFEVEHLTISIRKFDTKADCLAGVELILDALQYQRMSQPKFEETEYWGLYANDRCVSISLCPRPIWDNAGARIVLNFKLLAAYTPFEAIRYRESWKAQNQRREQRRAARIAEQKERRKKNGSRNDATVQR